MRKLSILLIIPLVTLLGISWVNPAEAQIPVAGIAGPDKHTCKKASAMFETQDVKIGPSAAVSGWCYSWEPSTGLSNPLSHNPTANPDETTTYTLKIVGDDFKWEVTDQVTVFVGEINSISATSKKCCFKKGTTFKREDFNITTDPPGLEDFVTFNPPVAGTPVYASGPEIVWVKTSCMDWGPADSALVQITVVNEDYVTQQALGIPNLAKFNWAGAVQKMTDNLMDWITDATPPGPCTPAFTQTLEANWSKGSMCCPDAGCVMDKYKIGVSYKPCVGTSCDIPFWGVPFIFTTNIALTANLCINLSGDWKSTCDDGQICLNGGLEANLGGGVSATALGGAALKAALLLVVKLTTPTLSLCMPSNKTTWQGKFCVQLDVVGEVTVVSMCKYKVQLPLITKKCLN